MGQEAKRHFIHYIALFLILTFGLLGFWYFSYRPLLQRIVVTMAAVLYILWGIVHHLADGDLNFKIVLEYGAIAALAATLLWIIIGAS